MIFRAIIAMISCRIRTQDFPVVLMANIFLISRALDKLILAFAVVGLNAQCRFELPYSPLNVILADEGDAEIIVGFGMIRFYR